MWVHGYVASLACHSLTWSLADWPWTIFTDWPHSGQVGILVCVSVKWEKKQTIVVVAVFNVNNFNMTIMSEFGQFHKVLFWNWTNGIEMFLFRLYYLISAETTRYSCSKPVTSCSNYMHIITYYTCFWYCPEGIRLCLRGVHYNQPYHIWVGDVNQSKLSCSHWQLQPHKHKIKHTSPMSALVHWWSLSLRWLTL